MKKILCLLLCVLMLLPLFLSCERECEHEFVDGVCEKCDVACEHDFKNGVCTVCDMPCAHQFADGVCSVCDYVCVHSYEKGICNNCGAKNLTKDVLVGRFFQYARVEIVWSENVTDQEKENLRLTYRTEDDETLFDKIMMLNGGIYVGDAVKRGYYFKRIDVRPSSTSSASGMEYTIKDNNIIIQNETFYYEKDRIYTLRDSEDVKGIAFKTVFIEVES